MSAAAYPRVIIVGGAIEGGGTPVEVSITEVADNLTINSNSNGQSTQTYFIDADGNAIALQTAFAAPASSGDNEIVNGVAQKKIRVIGYDLQGKGTVSAHFRSGSTPISMTWDFQAREGVVHPPRADVFLFETAVNTDLNLNLSLAVGVNVQVWYILVS